MQDKMKLSIAIKDIKAGFPISSLSLFWGEFYLSKGLRVLVLNSP